VTIQYEDSDLLRDIIRTLDPHNPLGRHSRHSNTERLSYWLELRAKQKKFMEKFQEKRAMKLVEGLHPTWNRDGVLKGWASTPSRDPPMVTPWWEQNMPDALKLQNPCTVWGR
jgi:hypothetical protein